MISIVASTVQQILIRGAEGLDPIRVMIEDFELGQGRITITCWDNAWVNYWGAMSKSTMAEFFLRASTGYLADKMKSGIEREVCDQEALDRGCRAEVIKQRRAGDIDKKDARALWERIDWAELEAPVILNSDLFDDIFGEEWWCQLPQRQNPEYVYLCKIIEAVKAGLRLHAASEVPA
ncbi:MAG: hypothetical protein K0R43_1677 [Pseudoduganella sp.]|jgi:hypothetical protein|nr:hypothetical protein [Pseudoduganella sp.]